MAGATRALFELIIFELACDATQRNLATCFFNNSTLRSVHLSNPVLVAARFIREGFLCKGYLLCCNGRVVECTTMVIGFSYVAITPTPSLWIGISHPF
ncbi:hypothetical protein U1Q18_050664 [Sarracenia purpurea var. burkii]